MSPNPAGDVPSTFESVPLFPLPGVVLFPHAVLPLHIFEERYKVMTADALAGDRRLAMALLRPGWEKNYYGRPQIEPVVCVGEILTHESLPEGKYNFLLRGLARATIVREHSGKPYRVADLETVPEIAADDGALATSRRVITEVLGNVLAATLPAAKQFLQMLSTPLPTETIADVIAFHLLDDIALKQQILSEPDVGRRVSMVIEGLFRLKPAIQPVRVQGPENPSWN